MINKPTTLWQPCREGHERCAVDGVECECEARHVRMGPSPTVCRVMAKFEDRLGHHEAADQWRAAAETPEAKGNA
jgi:hypothetical protein